MRQKILTELETIKGLYIEIATIYSAKLPQNIIEGATRTVQESVPRHANNFIKIINMVEQKNLFPAINNIDDGIQVFSNVQLDASITKALADKNIIATDGHGDSLLAEELLPYSYNAIKDCRELLQLQIATAKLSL